MIYLFRLIFAQLTIQILVYLCTLKREKLKFNQEKKYIMQAKVYSGIYPPLVTREVEVILVTNEEEDIELDDGTYPTNFDPKSLRDDFEYPQSPSISATSSSPFRNLSTPLIDGRDAGFWWQQSKPTARATLASSPS